MKREFKKQQQFRDKREHFREKREIFRESVAGQGSVVSRPGKKKCKSGGSNGSALALAIKRGQKNQDKKDRLEKKIEPF